MLCSVLSVSLHHSCWKLKFSEGINVNICVYTFLTLLCLFLYAQHAAASLTGPGVFGVMKVRSMACSAFSYELTGKLTNGGCAEKPGVFTDQMLKDLSKHTDCFACANLHVL